jgi:O-acetyl-ADP-ribose deacetylase (regulator of RNase III)
MTKGYRLPAKHILHTVGPVWGGGGRGEADTLRSCYVETLKLAEAHGIETVAFPCISTGVYGYPQDKACEVAVAAVTEWLDGHALPREATFCCFLPSDESLYRARLKAIGVET